MLQDALSVRIHLAYDESREASFSTVSFSKHRFVPVISSLLFLH